MKIAVVVSVCGHQKYFDYAHYSISSFVKNCPNEKMFVLTDNCEKLKKYQNENIILKDFAELKNKYSDKIKDIIEKSRIGDCPVYFDYNHIHHYVSTLLPVMQFELAETDFEYILKIDCDSYFAGGNFLDIARKHIDGKNELYVVRRDNAMMQLFRYKVNDGNQFNQDKFDYAIGVGFTMWKINGNFIDRYIKMFGGVEQDTIWDVMKTIKYKTIDDARLHFVLPFDSSSKNCNIDYGKDELMKYLPAYFHVHDIANMEKFKLWFPF